MGTGYLTIETHTADDAIPVANAHVTIKRPDGVILYETDTNAGGNTDTYSLTAPDIQYTLDPSYQNPAYSICTVDVVAKGFETEHIEGVAIVDTQTTILPVNMRPLPVGSGPVINVIVIPTIGLLIPLEQHKIGPPGVKAEPEKKVLDNFDDDPPGDPPGDPPETRVFSAVTIPDYITVHLGVPTDTSARNVRVRFIDYIKNVTSSEIYSTWPQNSLIANIHAIVTFALNRVFTEWYRLRGNNFDITNSTRYDQYFREGGPIFQNISVIVDEIFNVYARRIGFINPFFTEFCNGSTVTCPGMSQWGTVGLANQGKTPLEILRYYYPNDLELITSDNIGGISESFPGYSLRVGSQGEPVRRMQNFLNRIRVNYPIIPRISNPNGTFDTETENAVKAFQKTFDLPQDGVIGRGTWNKISFIYVAVTRLAELDSEGERIGIGLIPPNVTLSQGSRGEHVLQLQFILNAIAPYHPTVPTVIKDGVFDTETRNAVIEFQKNFGITPDGWVGPNTWRKLYDVYNGIMENAPAPPLPPPEVIPPPPEITPPPSQNIPPYPGTPLRVGSRGENVRIMQQFLNSIGAVYTSIPQLVEDGIFGEMTRRSVVAFQREFLLSPDGIIGPKTWNEIVRQYGIVNGNVNPPPTTSPPFPGTLLRMGSRGDSVRLMQQYLMDLRSKHPNIPSVTIDGVFGPNTLAAVVAFQKIAGLTTDGIIGPITWNAIITQRNAL